MPRSKQLPIPLLIQLRTGDALLVAPLLLWRFLVQCLLKTDTKWSSGGHPSLVVVSMPDTLLAAPPPLVVLSYSIPIGN